MNEETMYDYISLRVNTTPSNETINDLLAAFLADLEFETFVPDESGLTAYVRKDLYNPAAIEALLSDFPIETEFKVEETVIEGEDWNKEWEQNYYEPIVISDRCVIRSTFHKESPKGEIEIIIDPKMAFGTGHHSTTAAMVTLLLDEPMAGQSVIDMGTGTGILAILCKKLGAKHVTGVEIDPYALENAEENGELNGVKVNWICGDAGALKNLEAADYFLANINRNVILSDISSYCKKLKEGGKLLLSGFYDIDLEQVKSAAEAEGLRMMNKIVDNEWVGVVFEKEKQ